jgi:hypothetical protein
MATECGNVEEDLKPVQHREYHYVMDHHASLHECLNVSDNTRDPVRGIFLEELIEISEIFIRAVSRGCARSL